MNLLFFAELLDMSVKGGIMILAILLTRPFLRKMPVITRTIIWVMTGVRLVIPVDVQSGVSLIPPEVANVGTTGVTAAMTMILEDPATGQASAGADTAVAVMAAAFLLWFVGAGAMALYFCISSLGMRHRLRESVMLRPGIFACDRISSPFIFGMWDPRIYVPSFIGEGELEYIIAHEMAHVRRKDHWWKPLAFVILTVHFFNPLVWVGYVMFCQELELACDEAVTKKMSPEDRIGYANALISCSSGRDKAWACPVTFGGSDVKLRVQTVLNTKPAKDWEMIAAAAFAILIVQCFYTDPGVYLKEEIHTVIDTAITDRYEAVNTADTYFSMDWNALGKKREGNKTTVYMWVMHEEYTCENGELVRVWGGREAVAITVENTDGEYSVTKYWEPRDGIYYTDDIRAKFPVYLQGEVLLGFDDSRETQEYACRIQAAEYFGVEEQK